MTTGAEIQSNASLKKSLGTLDVFSIAAGAMISSGLFVLPGIAFGLIGPALIVAYVLAGLLMVPTMLSQAELASAMPRSGASYFFVERSLGSLIGTFAGLANWFSISLKAAFALIGIGALGTFLFPGLGLWGTKLVAIAACVGFGLLNALGAKDVGRFQVYLVFGLIAILGLFVYGGSQHLDAQSFTPFIQSDLRSLFAVTGMVFVSFGGLTKVVDVSEEIRNPAKSIVRGMFLSFIVVNLLYVLVLIVTVGTVPGGELAGSLVPLNLSAERTVGRVGSIAMTIGAFLAFATTANAGILSASRSPMAMSRDGLLPKVLSKTSVRYATPLIAISVTVAFIAVAIAVLPLESLVKTASTMMIVMFTLVNVALLVIRGSRLMAYRPTFRAPLYPWLQIAAIVVYGFLIAEMGWIPLVITGSFALAGLAWYVGYVSRRIDRESAFIHLVRSVAAERIQRSGFENELREIALQSDRMVLDRFDRLVQQCPILDIDETVAANELFQKIAEVLAPRVGRKMDELYEQFLARERESSTVVEPGLAIPHVVVEGENIFELVLVRCRGGIVFSDLHPPVRTVFVLVGSPDERNYHLRALMTIAHVVRHAEFRERWFQAKNTEQLRDVVLLMERERGRTDH